MWKDGELHPDNCTNIKKYHKINSLLYMNTEISIFCEVVNEREVQEHENLGI